MKIIKLRDLYMSEEERKSNDWIWEARAFDVEGSYHWWEWLNSTQWWLWYAPELWEDTDRAGAPKDLVIMQILSGTSGGVDSYLQKNLSVQESVMVFYPFLFYFVGLTWLLIWGALQERVLRRELGFGVVGESWKAASVPFFNRLLWEPRRKHFPFAGYQLGAYNLVVRLNLLTAKIYRAQYQLLGMLFFLVLGHYCLAPVAAALYYDFVTWSHVPVGGLACPHFFYLFVLGHLGDEVGLTPDRLESYAFFNHFYSTDATLLVLGILLVILLIIFMVFERLVLLELVCNYEYAILFGYNVLSQCLLLCCCNFFTLLVLFEIFSYTMYILIALRKQVTFVGISQRSKGLFQTNPLASEAGMKYFLFGAVNSLCFIVALIGLLIPNYDLSYANIAYFFYQQSFSPVSPVSGWVVFFLFVFFLFKLGAFPFHWWLPDVFMGSSLLVVSYIGLPVKLTFLALFGFIFYGVFTPVSSWGFVAVSCSLIGMLWGAIGMVSQQQLKRFFAYSTINHLSYILYGFSLPAYIRLLARAEAPTETGAATELQLLPSHVVNYIFSESLTATGVYLIGYLVMMLMVFIFLALLQTQNCQVGFLGQFSSMVERHGKKFRVVFVLLLMSLIGVPPLIGFWGKYYLFFVAIQLAQVSVLFPLGLSVYVGPVVIVVSSVIAAYGYLLLMKNMYVPPRAKVPR